MAGALVAISALPASTTLVTSDVLPVVVSGVTKKMTAGNLRTQLFGLAQADPLNIGVLTAVGNSTITGTLGGVTALTTALSGDLLFTDATYDIGKTGATRPRDGFFSRNLVVGSAITSGLINSQTISSASSFTGSVTVANGLVVTAGNVAMAGQMTTLGATAPQHTWTAAYSVLEFGPIGGIAFRPLAAEYLMYAGVYNDGAEKYALSGVATTAYFQLTGTHNWYTAPAGTAGNACTLTNRMNLSATLLTVNVPLTVTGLSTLAALSATTASFSSTVSFTSAASKILPGATSFSIRDNADTTDRVLLNSTGLHLAATLFTTPSVVGQSGFNIPSGTAPTSPVDGDMWYDGAAIKFRIGASTKTFTVT